jgi:hypothetical protein
VLCEGKYPGSDETERMIRELDMEAIDAGGRTLRFPSITTIRRNDARFWFIFRIAPSPADIEERGGLAFAITNFCPTELRFLRKSDNHELTRLRISH